jgi:hypothetical protein
VPVAGGGVSTGGAAVALPGRASTDPVADGSERGRERDGDGTAGAGPVAPTRSDPTRPDPTRSDPDHAASRSASTGRADAASHAG